MEAAYHLHIYFGSAPDQSFPSLRFMFSHLEGVNPPNQLTPHLKMNKIIEVVRIWHILFYSFLTAKC